MWLCLTRAISTHCVCNERVCVCMRVYDYYLCTILPQVHEHTHHTHTSTEIERFQNAYTRLIFGSITGKIYASPYGFDSILWTLHTLVTVAIIRIAHFVYVFVPYWICVRDLGVWVQHVASVWVCACMCNFIHPNSAIQLNPYERNLLLKAFCVPLCVPIERNKISRAVEKISGIWYESPRPNFVS